MGQELKSKVAIIGGGPAGCCCAYFLQNYFDVTIYDKKSPLLTLLPTGGGRCNLAHAEYDFKELAKNYPRGEKFLYSVFSRFSSADTIEFFEQIGVKTYIQDDLRIFPTSNSAKDVREKLLNALNKVKFVKEEVLKINPPHQAAQPFSTNGEKDKMHVETGKNTYDADYIVVATGGHASYKFIRALGHNIIDPKPSLTGLVTKEDFSALSGVVVGGILFTHRGISGPLVYKISSLRARDKFPYKLSFNLWGNTDLQIEFNNNPHKNIKNLLSNYIPKSFAEYILENLGISSDLKCCEINGKIRDKILEKLSNFEVTVVGTVADGEVVTSGGVDVKEVNSKTMESKIVKNLYFCGEVLDIDGFCGGFNLQNCWSTGFIAAKSIKEMVEFKSL